MKVGVVCVHYHAAGLTVQAMDAIRRDATSSGLEVKAVIVDNGSTAAEAEKLRTCGVKVLESVGNSGYAGGVNRGALELADSVDVLIAMNPDVLVQPGCLRLLVDEIGSGAAVVGPRFFWDRVGGYQLPPTEASGREEELVRALAERGTGWATLARRRWRRHAYRHWQSEKSIPSYDLSGALLAISTGAWQEVGPFDEAYQLYFEETDWLQRCRRQGLPARFVGPAHAIHLYAQSTPTEPKAQQWFAQSQERFRNQYYGRSFVALLQHLAGASTSNGSPSSDPGANNPGNGEPLDPSAPWSRGKPLWIEISPAARGFPAAAHRIEDGTREPVISEALWRQMAPGPYYFRAIHKGGAEGAKGWVLKPKDAASSVG